MAAEAFRIEIPIHVEDKTDPGVSKATEKMNKFDKQNEKTKKRLDQMNKTKWQVAIEAVDKVTSVVSKIGTTVRGVAGRAWSFTMSVVDKVTAPVKKMISVLGDMLGISTAVSTVLAGISVKNALQASADMARMQSQLKVSASNMGIDSKGIDAINAKATEMQKTTMYTDEAMVGAAAELATYFEDVDAITRMMDTVADYAAGMSGGVELSTEDIVDYTTNLAKMTTGAYDAMTKKGFEVTDAQKKILETGTDMEKVAVIESIIKENWEGMAEAMASTPTGYLIKMKNAWDQISGTIGDKLTPGFTKLYKMIYDKMPGIEKILTRVAEGAGTWIEEFVPTLEEWIDSAITKVEEFGDLASQVFSSDEFKKADFFGKVKIAWNKIIAEPFSEWWESTGKAWFAEKMNGVGEAIGSGFTVGLLALLGIDLDKTLQDGTSVGGAFIEGFKKGFDTEKITEALKEWADNNKEVVIGIGAVVGFNLITGIAGKLNDLISLFRKDSGGSSAADTATLGTMTVTSTTTTVNGTVVNVYGATVNNASGSGVGTALKNFLPSLAGGAAGTGLLLGGGKTIAGLLGSGGAKIAGLLGGGTAAAGGTATGLTAAGSWLSKLLTLGSTSSVIGADGTLLAVQGGLGGTLGSFAGSLGSGATTAAGAAAVGGASVGGIIGGVLGLGSAIIDLFQGIGKSKEGDKKAAKDEYWKAGTKTGMVGAGAGIGAGIGALFGGVGAGPGALIGAGIGGIISLFTGDAAGKALSDGSDEGGWLSNAWEGTKKFFKEDLGKFFTQTIPKGWNSFWGAISNFFTTTIPTWWGGLKEKVSTFFTETIPEKWDEMWEGIGAFFTEDVPYAIGYACGKIEIFFTETIPGFFGDLWDGISTFFSDTLPTWASDVWNNHIVPFFTETIPEFFGGIFEAIGTFFTDTLPTWASDVWNNSIVPFFTEDIPNFFSGLWNSISTFFTDTLPTWASDTWNNHIVPFFTESIPSFFSTLWNSIKTFFTETLPTWASNIWNNNIVPFFTETIPGFFSSVWEAVKKLFTEAIPTLASNIWGAISGWFSSIGDWFGDVWDKVSGFFGAGYNDAKGKHAWGGIMHSPHVGLVAEDGPEAIIPLSPSKSARGLDLWMRAGEQLGVRPYAEGGIVGDIPEDIPVTTFSGSGGGNHFDINIEVNPEFVIEGDDLDEETIVTIIKSRIREMVDDIGDEMADRLARIFANMPLKGGA
ncbi:MAG: hypothetical protein IJE16_05490 [Ruminococcus sp.]|nr:hypothetical protein [Ruminococcus sp.]